MADEGRIFNFKLDEQSAVLLDGFAKAGNCSRAKVIRDALVYFAEIAAAALLAQQEVFAELVEEIGDDATIILFAEADENDQPVVHVDYSWAAPWEPGRPEPAPLKAHGAVVGDRLRIFLDPGEHAHTAVVSIAGETLYIPNPQIDLGPGTTLSWPPKPHEAIRLELGVMVRHGFDPAGNADVVRRYHELIQALHAAAGVPEVEAEA